MEKINMDFIKKTMLDSPVELVGFGKQKPKNTMKIQPEAEKRVLKEYESIPKTEISKIIRQNPRMVIKTFRKGSSVLRWDLNLNYKYVIDYKTGHYMRSEYLDSDGTPTGKEVFAANFPHLIDVGIMGHCTHGQTGLCLKSGVQCYQNGLEINKPNMSLDDFRKIASECSDLTNQFALGGRGDPNEHEYFEEILKICRENKIIPNYTTSGFGLTDHQVAITKKYCGAVAVSWYRNEYTLAAIKHFTDAGIKTNIHYVLNTDTIDEAIDRLENDGFPEGINAVIFLTHKPVGLGEKSKCLKLDNPAVRKLLQLINAGGFGYKIGVDGSLVVGIINSGLEFNMDYLDTCEAGRFTCYIDADLIMHPCSFDVNDKYTVDLHKCSISEAWHSDTYEQIRRMLKEGCEGCENKESCMGGCFLHRDIVLCNRKERKQ